MKKTDGWTAKWPRSIAFIRHAESAYNELKKRKSADPDYKKFVEAFGRQPLAPETRVLAAIIKARYALKYGDHNTPVTTHGLWQARETGKRIRKVLPFPDVIICSPYLRPKQTLGGIIETWPELQRAEVVYDHRVREQDHGLALLYNDWRIFQAMHPEQRELRRIEGPYYYRYPQGESVCDVRIRTHSMSDTIIREYAGLDVWVIGHHLGGLAFRADYERLTEEQFIDIDENHKPSNCGITLYRCDPDKGRSGKGKLELEFYNKVLYKEQAARNIKIRR